MMIHLLLGSASVWISIRVCASGFPLKEPTPKVELLGVLLVEVIICFIVLEGETLQATSPFCKPLVTLK